MSKDYHKLFDLVISKFLESLPADTTLPDYFTDDFSCRALLFAVCIKERDCNFPEYNEEELKTLQMFIEALPTGKQVFEKSLIVSCLDFFESRL